MVCAIFNTTIKQCFIRYNLHEWYFGYGTVYKIQYLKAHCSYLNRNGLMQLLHSLTYVIHNQHSIIPWPLRNYFLSYIFMPVYVITTKITHKNVCTLHSVHCYHCQEHVKKGKIKYTLYRALDIVNSICYPFGRTMLPK